ncbi:MAG TPA: DUF4430 domain-containing protein [Candidatus Saccharimonadales bacterium]|nr:DUF4430 domain-containing protein [Candidatus Saccharimonadales bacterium]
MSRAALHNTKIIIAGLLIAVGLTGAAGIAYAMVHHNSVHTVTDTQHHMVQISYQGQTGTDALILLKHHASVQTKHYSFGDMVTAIDGVAGNGPKYWTFYVNGRMSDVGAQAYTTKSSDTLLWKLQ